MERCETCHSTSLIRNGHSKAGKQQWVCKSCGRCRVENATRKIVPNYIMDLIRNNLLERTSLRGICRVFGVGLHWLLQFMTKEYASIPTDLGITVPMTPGRGMEVIIAEADELWSFVGSKDNPVWVWLLLDLETRQVVACHFGGRTRNDAICLWRNVPEEYRKVAFVFTDFLRSYEAAIPKNQHAPVGKDTGLTNHVERFNCTLRQRISRLVRKSLSFSKSLVNHIGAIRYFLHDYNRKIVESP